LHKIAADFDYTCRFDYRIVVDVDFDFDYIDHFDSRVAELADLNYICHLNSIVVGAGDFDAVGPAYFDSNMWVENRFGYIAFDFETVLDYYFG